MKRNKLYDEVMNYFGIEAQIDMVFEETAELVKEFCKFKRYIQKQRKIKETFDLLDGGFRSGKTIIPMIELQFKKNIAEEIADVEIVLEQMKQYFGINKYVSQVKESKKIKLAKYIGVEYNEKR